MSLQIWLPLNGDLHNQGLNPLQYASVQTGCVIDDNGKIGKCYTNSGSSVNIAIPCVFSAKTFSACAWIRLNTRRNNWCRAFGMSGNGTYFGLGCEHTNGTGLGFHYYKTIDGTNTSIFDSYLVNISTGSWNHFAMCYDGIKYYIYQNGKLIKSDNARKSNIDCNMTTLYLFGGIANNYSQCSLNDVRIYDHCLSAKEVEELAKGLVLHYKLDGTSCPNQNLLKPIPQGYNPTAYNSYQLALRENLEANQIYTMQLWDINISHTGKTESNLGLSVYWGGGQLKLKDLNGTSYFTDGYANHLIFTFTPTAAQAEHANAANLWLNIYNSVPSADGTKNMYIGAWKLEKGNIATPWSNDENIVYDSSGYNNDGTIVGSLETVIPSPRYSCTTKFDGVTSCIKIPYNEINPDRIFTVNLWFYKDALGSKGYETLFGGPSGFEMDTRAGTATSLSLYMASTRGSTVYSPLNLNEWTMITMARDGTNEFYYVNGELKKTIEAKSMPSGQYRIGAWSSDTKQNYYGEISDFRIYATALTATQILELYHTSATIDNQGNTYGREIVEDEIVSITKQGQVKSNKIVEQVDTKTSIEKTTKNINSYSFYEY